MSHPRVNLINFNVTNLCSDIQTQPFSKEFNVEHLDIDTAINILVSFSHKL
jgi:hypothetical protein